VPGNPQPYVPVSCEFHDVLEGLASTQHVAPITWLGTDDRRQTRTGKVADVYSSDGAEYLLMQSGEIIRLDRIIEADGFLVDRFG
jgi:Rho-binding antiterminator